jgi:hypothetical protein
MLEKHDKQTVSIQKQQEKNTKNTGVLKTGNEAQLIVRSVPSVSVVSVAIAERSLIYFARVAGQGLRSISIAGRRKSKGQLRSPQTHGPAHGCKSVGACAYGEMLRQQSWILVLERRSGTCSCGWKLLILTLVILFFRLSCLPLYLLLQLLLPVCICLYQTEKAISQKLVQNSFVSVDFRQNICHILLTIYPAHVCAFFPNSFTK